MDFFTAFSSVLAVGFLASVFARQRIVDPTAFRRAMTLFLFGLICYYGVPMLFVVGAFLRWITAPIGFVLVLLSFRELCLSLMVASASSVAISKGNETESKASGQSGL